MPLNPGYQPIEPPALQIPRTGLVRSAVEVNPRDGDTDRDVPVDGGSRQPAWVGGFGYEPFACDRLSPLPILGCPDPEDDTDDKAAGDNPDLVQFSPYAVFGADECSTLDQSRDRAARARAQLLATESAQIAAEFEAGAVARSFGYDDNFYLAKFGAATNLGDEGAVTALGELELALGDCLSGRRGMIHANRHVTTLWASEGLIRNEQGLLLTQHDTIVVADAGYKGYATQADENTPPALNAALPSVYGTDLVYLLRGNIDEVGDRSSQIDRATNTWTVFVERPAAAYVTPCCVFRVQVDLTNAGVTAGA